MQFQTQISIHQSNYDIKYGDKILSIGSCFSEHLADILGDLKYDILKNPFGITFNPISIFSCIKRCIIGNSLLEEELIKTGNLWAHHDFHGSFNKINPQAFVENANISIQNANAFLKKVDFVIITLGTSLVYRLLSNKEIVNNCHKLPSNHFEQHSLSVEEIANCLKELISNISDHADKKVNFVLALSPVRYIKDGLIENQKSKASCLIAIHQICDQLDNVNYFPSYELVLDELRDYRFYKEDMVHPSAVAVKHVSEKFMDYYFNESESTLRNEITKIRNSLNHRPLHKDDPAFVEFQNNLLKKMELLEKKYPELSFELEKKQLI